MNKFYRNLSLFLIPSIGVWLAIEVFYRAVPNNYTLKYNHLESRGNDIEVLLFGDSHCMYGLNPDYFSKNTFNVANVSQTIFFDKLLFDKYCDLPNLKQVVFCIEYTNLSQAKDTQDDLFRKYYYQEFMHLDVPTISRFDPKQYALAFTQDFRRTGKLLRRYIKTRTLLDCNSNGWGSNYKKQDRIPPESVAAKRAKIQEDGSMNFSANTQSMQQIINACKKRNINVLIVSMPQTQIYESYLNHEKLVKIIATCSKLEKINTNVCYLNLFYDSRFKDEDFYDADHLNDSGAAKCSKIVNGYLNRMKSAWHLQSEKAIFKNTVNGM